MEERKSDDMGWAQETESKLHKLREPFSEEHISWLPKGTKEQNECQNSDKKNCSVCGGWHHPKIKHLQYVGHAALTNRLLDVDPFWSWEPMSYTEKGLPLFDEAGGLWIRLTICGVTRPGYGDVSSARGKTPGDAIKEIIGDALRNGAMRFGCALDLWFKGDAPLMSDEPSTQAPVPATTPPSTQAPEEPSTPAPVPGEKVINDIQLKTLKAEMLKRGVNRDKFLTCYGITTEEEILSKNLKGVMSQIMLKPIVKKQDKTPEPPKEEAPPPPTVDPNGLEKLEEFMIECEDAPGILMDYRDCALTSSKCQEKCRSFQAMKGKK